MNQNSSGSESETTGKDQAFDLMQRGLAISDENPSHALELLEQSASKWLRQGDKRRAAFVLHQRASLSLKNSQSPIKDLAMAARLLKHEPEARAVVLLDLGQALAEDKQFRKAMLALRESEKLARKANNMALSDAARYALGDVSVGGRKKVTVKSEIPHRKAPTPKVATPKVATPEVATPEVAAPEVAAPEVVVPEVDTPEVAAPEVVVSEVHVPEVHAPEVTVPEVTVPEVDTSEVAAPEVAAPEVDTSEVVAPEVDTSEVDTPEVAAPEVAAPEVVVPKVDTSEVAASQNGPLTDFTMIYEVENDLLTSLHQIGTLSDDPWAKWERERRAQAVEDELAALKREMGM